ncbi:MAG: hypothetical protein RR232_00155 [Clostridia bacterium]
MDHNQNVDKPKLPKKLGGLILPAVLVGFCIALYFATGTTGSTSIRDEAGRPISTHTQDVAEQADDVQTAAVLPSYEFFKRAKELGLNDTWSEKSTDARERKYTISSENGINAELTLKLKDGNVISAVLAVKRPVERIDGSLVKADIENGGSFELQKQWIRETAGVFIDTMDVGDWLSDSDRSAFLLAIESTISDKKTRKKTAGSIYINASVNDSMDEDELIITASFKK